MNAIHGASQAVSLLPASFAGIVLIESFYSKAERSFLATPHVSETIEFKMKVI